MDEMTWPYVFIVLNVNIYSLESQSIYSEGFEDVLEVFKYFMPLDDFISSVKTAVMDNRSISNGKIARKL